MNNDLSARMRLARLMSGGGDSDGIRPVRRTSGTAVSDSAGGKVTVRLSDGDPIEVPTAAKVKQGDTVSLLVADGVATNATVSGWGDSIQSQADAAQSTADDAYSRTLRVQISSSPADATGDTSMLTATVWRGGQQLTEQEVAMMGLVAWYVAGKRVATGYTYSCAAGTAVECRFEG